MRVTVLQTDISWLSPQDNIRRAESLIDAAPLSDIYVLPEMWNTGFVTQKNVGIDQRETILWMSRKADELDAAVCGSLCVTDSDGMQRNRFYFIEPGGKTTTYDKRHLFGYSGEDKYYTCGNEQKIVEFRGVRFFLAVCYDLRFPVWLRNQDCYDAMIVVANWPEAREYAWQTLLRARAIENQCHVIACNRIGKDTMCDYSGLSAILDSRGMELATAPAHTQATITADIDLEKQNYFREKHRDLYNRDKFVITDK